jgi:hypothetical protein
MTSTRIINSLAAGILFSTLALSGCNKAETPAEVRNDVADARKDASANVTDARQEAATDINADAKKLVKTAADSAHEVAIAEAEGAHKVSVEKCEALSGQAQTDCKDTAKATLAMANAKADSALTAARP